MAEVAVMMALMRVGVIVEIVAVIAVRMAAPRGRVMFAPVAPDHPQRDAENERARDDLEIGLAGLGAPARSEIEPRERDQPDDRGMRNRRCDSEHHGLRHGSANRDDEGRHHGLGVAGLQPMQGAEQNGGRNEQIGVGGAGVENLGQIGHCEPALLAGAFSGEVVAGPRPKKTRRHKALGLAIIRRPPGSAAAFRRFRPPRARRSRFRAPAWERGRIPTRILPWARAGKRSPERFEEGGPWRKVAGALSSPTSKDWEP